jgi:hypothetical protein
VQRLRTPLVVLVAAFGLFACGSSSSSSSTTTTTVSVCGAKADLQASLQALVDPSTLSGGKSGITKATDAVKQDLDALGGAIKSDLKPDVDAVKSSLDGLKSAIGKLGTGATGSGLSAVGNAITKVSTSTSKLVDAITTRCPSS